MENSTNPRAHLHIKMLYDQRRISELLYLRAFRDNKVERAQQLIEDIKEINKAISIKEMDNNGE